jgi:hypothetical protein
MKLPQLIVSALLASACAQTRFQVDVPVRSPAVKKIELVFEQPSSSRDQMTFTIRHPLDYQPVFAVPGDDLTVRYGDDPVTLSYPGTGRGHDRVAIIPPRNLPQEDKRRRFYRVEVNVNDSVDESTCSAIARDPYVVGVSGPAPSRVCVITYTAASNNCSTSGIRAVEPPFAAVEVLSSDGKAAPQITQMDCSDMR